MFVLPLMDWYWLMALHNKQTSNFNMPFSKQQSVTLAFSITKGGGSLNESYHWEHFVLCAFCFWFRTLRVGKISLAQFKHGNGV